ncbi:hypothetical protein JTE90_003315 [Oedothorax gibbosus]|uniref:Reverse transcriptase n=1 Tax=Oedothorax gibbosus TaxID=931172 RepID=A0AAV6TIC9_9ARAC|nr:hypothetical protein JTE90_003315 [Oedothorax gibbosus]
MRTFIPLATPPVASRTRGKTVPQDPPVTPPGAPQPPPVTMEPPSDSVPVTHTASSPGPMNSPSSPPLDENWSLTEQAQKITLPTHVPGSPPLPATPPALLPVCPSSPSPSPATAPGINTSWSLAFSPSLNQSNPLLSFEATLELNETRPKGEMVSTTPLKIPTPPPPITHAQDEGTSMAPQTAPPDWRPILSPPLFQTMKCPREAPFFAPPTSLPPPPMKTQSPPLEESALEPRIATNTSPTPEESWTCDFCERKFTKAADCDAHLAEVHLFVMESDDSLSPPPTAPVASPTNPSSSSGTRSDATPKATSSLGDTTPVDPPTFIARPKDKAFSCSVCGWKFSKYPAFRRHKATHKQGTPNAPPAILHAPTNPGPSSATTFAGALSTHPKRHQAPPPNKKVFPCSVCKATPFPDAMTRDLHLEFAHSGKTARVVIQRERIFTSKFHRDPNPDLGTLPARATGGAPNAPAFPPPPAAHGDVAAAAPDSQDLFQSRRAHSRNPPPNQPTTAPRRGRPPGRASGNHKLSAARCPEEDLDDAPVVCTRKGQSLHVSFPMARTLLCTEASCPSVFASGTWNTLLQSLKRHLRLDHHTPISHVKKWCAVCPAVCPERISFHPCFANRDPTFLPEVDLAFRCELCSFQCLNRRQLRNHSAAHRNEELRVPRRPFASADLHPNRRRRGRDLHSSLQPPVPPRPSGRSNQVRTARPDNPRSTTEWVRSNAASSQLDCVPDPLPLSTHEDSPPPAATSHPPPVPALAARTGTIDEMAEWIVEANLPPPPKRKKRRRRRARTTSYSDSDVDPAVIEEMRRNVTPNPSSASSVPHSPSQATSPSQLPSSMTDQVAGLVDLQHPSTHPPSPPREDDDPLPLDDFIPHLNDLLASATSLSDSRWSEFEALLDEITTRIGEVVNLPPPRDDTVTSQPSTTDAGDHRTIQRLYKRNRRRAIRLITEGEGTRCHLEGNTITNHFQKVFSPSEFDQSIFCQATGRSTVPMDPFSPDEVKARLFKFENSAPGPDRISYSHLKEADPSCTAIAKVLNVCLRAKRIPYQWKTSRTILIHKKGNLDDISNWRPISLCATLYKLLTGCLASRLTTWLSCEGVLSDAQKGFLPFDGTFEHHFLVSREIRRTKTSGEELCMAQIDLANAFGSVPHAAIDTALLTAGVGEDFTHLIHDLYSGTSTEFIAGDGLTDRLEVRNGVRQGCPLSGLLFNLVIDPLVRGIQDAAPPSEDFFSVLAFADDLLVLGRSPDELQSLLDLLPSLSRRLGLSINPAKCRSIHLSGTTPRGHRSTGFRIDDQPLEVIPDHVPASFLGTPIGFQLFQNTEEVEKILSLAKKIGESCLAPWQRIDALKSFFFPTLNFAMRTGQFSKEQLHQIDDEVRKFVKVTLNLVGPASAASNHYIYGASDAGCLGLPCLEDEHDVVLVDSAFKLLTSRDPRVRNIAWSDLADQIEARTSSFNSRPDATPGQVEAFLSGSCDPPFHRGRSDLSSTWSAARNASRRLAVTWSCPEWGSISATFQEKTLQPADRRMLQRSIKTVIRSERALKLHEYPSQGIAMECVANSKWGNQFIRTGENIRFCDWRFIHKARLNLCSLNAQRRSSHQEEIDKSCRRCGHHTENLHHVVSTCRPLLHLRTKRHDAVLDRLIKARRRGFRVMGRNQDVDGSSLRPDLVLTQGDTAILIDVAVPYENRLTAFANTRRDKAAKYVQVCNNLRRTFANVHNEAIIVGALGSWDRANDKVLRKFVNKRFANKLRRLICTDVLSHTCDIFHQHVRGSLPDQARYIHPSLRAADATTDLPAQAPCPTGTSAPHPRSHPSPCPAAETARPPRQTTVCHQVPPAPDREDDGPPSSFDARFQRIMDEAIHNPTPQTLDLPHFPPCIDSPSDFSPPSDGPMPGLPPVCAFLPTGERAPPQSSM